MSGEPRKVHKKQSEFDFKHTTFKILCSIKPLPLRALIFLVNLFA